MHCQDPNANPKIHRTQKAGPVIKLLASKYSRFKMSRQKRKLAPSEKAEKKRRREQYMTVFMNGKQKRIKRPPTIDDIDVDEFIRGNADPIWLHQNEMWEYMENVTEYDEEINVDKDLDAPF